MTLTFEEVGRASEEIRPRVLWECDCGWKMETNDYVSGVLCPTCRKVCWPMTFHVSGEEQMRIAFVKEGDHWGFPSDPQHILGAIVKGDNEEWLYKGPEPPHPTIVLDGDFLRSIADKLDELNKESNQ